VHSPMRRGFIYSHVGWIFDRKHSAVDLVRIEDFAFYPELLWLHRFELVPAFLMGGLCFLIAGWSGVVVGFLWSTVLVYHSTFCINSLAHVRGSRRYVTGDDSRNNWLLALFTMGEGWHNNHHAYQSSARQGFRWWEIDVTYYLLWLLSRLGLVWDLKTPPESVLRNDHRLSARVLDRAAEQLAVRFSADGIARAITTALQREELAELHALLDQSRNGVAEVLAGLRLPGVPNRMEMDALASSMFSRARSLEEIVDRAYRLLMTAVANHLLAGPETA
jgi:stearoyl-CoA desaturase (delta-9 desaturase)